MYFEIEAETECIICIPNMSPSSKFIGSHKQKIRVIFFFALAVSCSPITTRYGSDGCMVMARVTQSGQPVSTIAIFNHA